MIQMNFEETLHVFYTLTHRKALFQTATPSSSAKALR